MINGSHLLAGEDWIRLEVYNLKRQLKLQLGGSFFDGLMILQWKWRGRGSTVNSCEQLRKSGVGIPLYFHWSHWRLVEEKGAESNPFDSTGANRR